MLFIIRNFFESSEGKCSIKLVKVCLVERQIQSLSILFSGDAPTGPAAPREISFGADTCQASI